MNKEAKTDQFDFKRVVVDSIKMYFEPVTWTFRFVKARWKGEK